jgi:hypothetical protein
MRRPFFNYEKAIFTSSVVGLIPLEFSIADETPLVGPLLRLRPAVFVKFIGPDKLISGI